MKWFKKKSPKTEGADEPSAVIVGTTDMLTKGAAKAKRKRAKFSFFPTDLPGERPLAKPELDYRRYKRLVKRVQVQAVIIIVCFALLFLALPVFKPSHVYLARQIGAPIGAEKRLLELDQPVITKESVKAWVTETVTEVLTYNFADYSERILMFQGRFNTEGWREFLLALGKSNALNQFVEQQLVATAVPSEPATIESEGINPKNNEFEWVIKVPIIRKFVTNNEVETNNKLTVSITVVRVPITISPSGLGIKVWRER
jgi:hypothetical protein